MDKKTKRSKPVILIVVLILVLVFLFSGLRFLESTDFHSTGANTETDRKTIIRDGVDYFPRMDTTVVLVAGIDEQGPVTDSGS